MNIIIILASASKNEIVEEWYSPDGLGYYRKYANGWVEQGGRANTGNNDYGSIETVQLFTPMKTSTYLVMASHTSGKYGFLINYCDLEHIVYNSLTTTSFKLESCSHFEYMYWKVEGFYK